MTYHEDTLMHQEYFYVETLPRLKIALDLKICLNDLMEESTIHGSRAFDINCKAWNEISLFVNGRC